jgi:hypothetical protein
LKFGAFSGSSIPTKPGPYRSTRRQPAEFDEKNRGKNINAADQLCSLESGKTADFIAV